MGMKVPIVRKISVNRIALVRRKTIAAAAKADIYQKELDKTVKELQALNGTDLKSKIRLETKRDELKLKLEESQRICNELQARHGSYIQKNFQLGGGGQQAAE